MTNVLSTTLGTGQQVQLITETGTQQFAVATVAAGGAVDATAVTYTPGVPANWSPAPATAQAAFDQLAAARAAGAGVIAYSPAVPANWSPPPTLVSAALDQLATRFVATGIAYTPGIPANWSPVPSAVNTALDQLAARPFTAATITYSAAVPGNWSPNPANIAAALDQLAAARAAGAPVVTYSPAVPGNWAPAPTQVASALDQLAARPTSGAYTPAVSTNWTPAPTTIAGALDQIAAISGNFFASGTIGPAGTVTFTTTNVAVQGNAQVLVIATFNAFGSVANTSAAVTLGIDGVPGTNLANANCACGAANGPMTATLIALTTLSRPGPHTFTVQGVATGGVLTVSAGFINVAVHPFGG